jgi:predicted ester cyclase
LFLNEYIYKLLIIKDEIMNKEETIKLSVNQLIEEGEFDVVEKVFSSNYIAHAGNKEYKGHDFIKKFAKQLRSTIPDVKVINIEFLNNSGNIITWQRTLSGTHQKNMMGIPASEKKIKWTDMIVSRFEGDNISEEWVVSELMGELLLKVPAKK